MANGNGLASVNSIVVLMLENRSFDHMLGYLYPGNVSPSGQPFDGLAGTESNPGSNGQPVTVFQIEPIDAQPYLHARRRSRRGLYVHQRPAVRQYQHAGLGAGGAWPGLRHGLRLYPQLAVQGARKLADCAGHGRRRHHGLLYPGNAARAVHAGPGYAVCDQWFASVPTETMPNRAFACAATSQGHMDDKTRTFTSPTIFGLLDAAGLGWSVYGYDDEPLTKNTFTQISTADASHFGKFTDFQAAAAGGTLPPYSFLEPSWPSTGNSQHPNYDVALGEQLIHDVYEALLTGPGWPGTLLVITYDEHGGCFDHVPPPWGAAPPDSDAGDIGGFGFDRFGVRVPAVLVSPLIAPGTVYRVPAGGTPLDHTSVLRTVEQRWNLPTLTARDAAAPAFGDVLTLTTPRTDDVLAVAGVTVPVASGPAPAAGTVSHLESIHADLIGRQLPAGQSPDTRPA